MEVLTARPGGECAKRPDSPSDRPRPARTGQTGCLDNRPAVLRSLLVGVLLTLTSPALASNHIVRINEVMAGLNGDSRIQFVELVAAGDGEKRWGPQGAESVGRAMLTFANAAGVQTGRLVFPADPSAGKNTVLIATEAFAELTGIAPDFIMPLAVMPIAGQVCFQNNPDSSNAQFVQLCLSYGDDGFTGATEGGGAANPAELAIMDSHSLSRFRNFDFAGQANADFQLATPTPATSLSPGAAGDLEQNNLGQTVLPEAASEVAQGDTLFTFERFLGNGRTCETCHRAADSFGLTPTRVTRLADDDPLFVNERNINTLVVNGAGIAPSLAGATQPSDYVLGSTIAGSLGGDATVLAGTGNTYLILGGDGLDIPGNVISDPDGNSATLVSFAAGNLEDGPGPDNGENVGLEDPGFLRGGFALVTENINGFAEQSFRRASPSLLNIKHTAPFSLSGGIATLQEFSTGAVRQHYPRDLRRRDGIDFRLPTSAELDAMTAFMETILAPRDGDFDQANNFDRFTKTAAAKRGRDLFFGEAKCAVCHNGPVLATSDGQFGTAAGVNEEFNIGVSLLPIGAPGAMPSEQDVGAPANSRTFSTPTLFGLGKTAPFFHNNGVATLLEAIQFYDGPQFRASPAFAQVGAIDAVSIPGNAEDIRAFLLALRSGETDLPWLKLLLGN